MSTFQFHKVRLKANKGSVEISAMRVSIPQGTIKSSTQLVDATTCNVSIPQGTIKRQDIDVSFAKST